MNGIMENVKTSEDQIQLLEHTAFQDQSQPRADDEVKDALVTQEVLGSWEHILAAPEPLPEAMIPTEHVPEAAAPAEISIEPQACESVEKAPSSVKEAAPEESVVREFAAEVKALVEAVEKYPVADAIQAETPAIVEEGTAVPAEVSPQFAVPFDDIVVSEPGETSQMEEVAVPVMSETPAEVTALVAAPLHLAAPVTALEPPHDFLESSTAAAPVLSKFAAPGEDAVPAPGEVFLYDSVHPAFHVDTRYWVYYGVMWIKVIQAYKLPPTCA